MAKWLLFPATNSFNNGANWDTGAVPTDVATFGATFGSTTIGIDAPITLGSFHFLSDAPAYTFNVNANVMLHGSGFVYENGAALASVNLGAGATLTVDSDGAVVLSNVEGAGDLVKQGAGVLTLIGNSNHASVTVASGTLAGNVQGNVVNNGTFILSVPYGATLTGNGTVVVPEAENPIWINGAGLQSFQGPIIVEGSLTLRNFNPQTGDPIPDEFVANPFSVSGVLNLQANVSGNISGSGAVVIQGTGDIPIDYTQLTGRNTYTGGTTIRAPGGYLRGTTDSLQGVIVGDPYDLDTTVGFRQSFDGVFAGVISGNANLAIEGPGAVTVTGHNTYTGRTLLRGGTLRLGAADSLPVGSVVNITNGTFDIGNLNLTREISWNLVQGQGGGVRLGGGTLNAPAPLTMSTGAFLTGFGVIQAPAVDGPGVVTATGGVLRFNGAFNTNSVSTVKIGSAAGTVLRFDGIVGSSTIHPVIDFEGGRGLLDLSPMSLANFHGLITDFASGEGIKVADARSVSLDATGHLLTVFNANHTSLGTLIFSQSYSGDGFLVSGKVISVSDSHGLDYSAAAGGVYTDLAAQFTQHAPAGQGWWGGPSSVIPVSTDTFINMVNVTGSAFDDLLVGGSQSGSLLGGAGNDLIYGNTAQATADNASVLTLGGGAGSNALYGSSGFNTFLSGDADGGFNQIWGAASKMAGVLGFANNTLSFENVAAGRSVYVDLLNGHNAYVNSGPQNNGTYTLEDSIANVPNVIGSSGGDVIIADNGPSRLAGAVGADQLYGGTGPDTFAYMAYGDSNLVAGYDAIYGFQSGTDKIDLSALNSDASHLLIQTAGTSNSVYLEQTPGSFNPNTDLAIVINTAVPGGVQASDFIF